MRPRLVVLACVIVLVVLASSASFSAQYSVSNAGIYSPSAINNSGQVVGQSSQIGYIWYAQIRTNGVTTNLRGINGENYSWASDINSTGQVVGVSNRFCAFWKNSTATPTAIMPTDSNYAQANGINDSGKITGYTQTNSNLSRAFTWKNGVSTVLGSLGGSYSWAGDVNDSGVVCGYADSATTSSLPCVWRSDNSIAELQTLQGCAQGMANKINDSGQIAGSCFDSSGHLRACFWSSAASAPVSIGVFPGFATSQAWGISAHGQVIGISVSSSNVSHAFMWQDGISYDLNNLIPANSGWVLTRAENINDLGQIVGEGTYNGTRASFVLTPVPEPSGLSVLICGVAALGGIVRRRRA